MEDITPAMFKDDKTELTFSNKKEYSYFKGEEKFVLIDKAFINTEKEHAILWSDKINPILVLISGDKEGKKRSLKDLIADKEKIKRNNKFFKIKTYDFLFNYIKIDGKFPPDEDTIIKWIVKVGKDNNIDWKEQPLKKIYFLDSESFLTMLDSW